jgi:hypothetical protein
MTQRPFDKSSSSLALLVVLLFAATALAERTVWLVRPLYPGQEALVEKTEKALDRLVLGEARHDTIIGLKELEGALRGRSVEEVPCFSGERRCSDPTDAFVAGLGFDRVVLIQGGQDEAGFKYRVVAYEPKTGKTAPASASNANLEKALLGAVAKVVPAASTMEIKTTPSGATVFIDDVKVGLTPLTTQVLPGERLIRLDLKLHQPIEEAVVIPIRGTAVIERPLEKVAARIVITAAPAGADIWIDGQMIGKDKVDRGILPGAHVIRLGLENHKSFEQTITVKADEQYVLDKTLEPIPSQMIVDPNNVPREAPRDTPAAVRVIRAPLSPEELVYSRTSYVHLTYEFATLTGNALVGRRFGTAGWGRTEDILTKWRDLMGVSLEYGTMGRYFGMTVFGLGYLTNSEPWRLSVGFGKGLAPEQKNGEVGPSELEPVRINLVAVRALQPQFRIVVWRFVFGLQLGFEFRTGQISGVGDTFYVDGFVPMDLMLSGRVNAKFVIYDGLYAIGSFNYTQHLIGETTDAGRLSASHTGFQFGVGYAF